MRICLVTLDSPLELRRDGISVHVFELAKALQELNNEVWIVGFVKGEIKEQIVLRNGINYYSIPDRGLDLLSRMVHFVRKVPNRLLALEKNYLIDVFHGQGGYAGPIALALKKGLKALKIATIHTLGVEEQTQTVYDLWKTKHYWKAAKESLIPPFFLRRFYGRWVYSNMDAIISVTEYNRRKSLKEYGIALRKNFVIPNGVNYRRLKSLAGISRNVEAKKKVMKNILFFGRLSPRKGVQILLRAIPDVLRIFPQAKLTIIGEGEYKEYLEKLSRKLSISDCVSFKGFVPEKQLITNIILADIIVLPSIFEGLPLAMLESMALRKTVIVSSVTGIPEIVEDGKNGILFKPGNSKDLAKKINMLLSDPPLREKIARNAEEFVRENLTWEKIAKQTLDVYKNLLGRK